MSSPGLDQLRRELADAAQRRARSPRVRWLRATLIVAAIVATGSGTATAVSLVASLAPDDPNDPIPTAPTTPASAPLAPPSSEQLSRMRRERLRSRPKLDASRWFSVLQGPAPHVAVDNTVARVTVRATERDTCVAVLERGRGGATTSCVPTREARTRGAMTISQCRKSGPPQQRLIGGVIPDGASRISFLRDGIVQSQAPVTTNGFAVKVDEPIDEIMFGRARIPLPPATC